ncbi:hypothetical protein C5746_02965 [Streptomyces atratus]|uniref:Uncharacterized protein n=1 Tax=Streptomyces atratus TaxID=1893 RepID=A0A2Z5J719_STRAR|nr:hypothetical protein C5746_02965 [Streptomyces atratus]
MATEDVGGQLGDGRQFDDVRLFASARMQPERSPSCRQVWMTQIAPSASRQVWSTTCHQSHARFRTVGESTPAMSLTGSSTMAMEAPLAGKAAAYAGRSEAAVVSSDVDPVAGLAAGLRRGMPSSLPQALMASRIQTPCSSARSAEYEPRMTRRWGLAEEPQRLHLEVCSSDTHSSTTLLLTTVGCRSAAVA